MYNEQKKEKKTALLHLLLALSTRIETPRKSIKER